MTQEKGLSHRTGGSATPVTLVSIFGRGNELAARLLREQIPFQFYDLTPSMGVWPPEDIAGPFGFFLTEQITDLQKEVIFVEDAYEEVSNGFTLLLREGPLEFKGPLTLFRLKKMGFPDGILEDEAWKVLEKKWKELEFQQIWPLHLANYLPATRDSIAPEAAQRGIGISFGASFYRRIPMRNSVEKTLGWLESQGASVLRGKKILDFSKKGKNFLSGMEIAGEGMEFTDHLVWCLSSEETYFLDPRIGATLYPKGSQESQWCWLRFRILLENNMVREVLPSHFCMIHQVEAPWTHENLMIVLATGSLDQYDVWVKAPTVQRFNKDYLVRLGDKVMQEIYYKLGEVGCRMQSYPQEFYYTYSQIGAPRFPVFEEGVKIPAATSPFKNFYGMSPEHWDGMHWQGQFQCTEKIYNVIKNAWDIQLQAMQKQQMRNKYSLEENRKESEK